MEFNHRKMFVSYLPKDFNFTVYIPCFETYPPPPPPPPSDLSLLVTTMICMAGSVLLFLCILVLVHHLQIKHSQRTSTAEVTLGNTNRREEDEDETDSSDHHVWRINTSGLHRSVINSITVVGFKKEEGIINGTECSVCLNEFKEDESIRLLPKCNHAFHINCIDTWFLSHKNCPLCRAPVLVTEICHQETNHQSLESASSINRAEESSSSSSRNVNVVLTRTQSDLVNHCGGSGSVETVRRSFSIGGNFFSSSRRSRNQEPVLPTQLPSVSG